MIVGCRPRNSDSQRTNRGHQVIAEMEGDFDAAWTLTQEVDGLHGLAGPRRVMKIHGDLHDLACTRRDHGARMTDYAGLALPRCTPPGPATEVVTDHGLRVTRVRSAPSSEATSRMLRSIRPKRAVSLALGRMMASSAAVGIAQGSRVGPFGRTIRGARGSLAPGPHRTRPFRPGRRRLSV